MIFHAGILNANAQGSESNSSSDPCRPKKRMRNDNESCLIRFKGVVLQQNGHWGAQIYANHQRIWLGTFKSDKEAAMAYDSAAIKLRSGDSHRNFPWTDLTLQEPDFQHLHTTESVLNMIKDGSYETKFKEFLANKSDTDLNLVRREPVQGGGIMCQQLFQKELTPSDVGKLNRLVIPKKHAIKYFPQVSEVSSEEDDEGSTGQVDEIQLLFFDRGMKSWKFRYCYWKSSQSFVFTRGWNRFVKDKDLKAKDVITFYRCEHREAFKEERTFCMIDVGYNRSDNDNSGGLVGGFDGKIELQLGWGQNFNFEFGSDHSEKKRSWQQQQHQQQQTIVMMEMPPAPTALPELPSPPQSEAKGVRLFGVQICRGV
ncbi:hypothetical protein NE237_020989 [Protea cynaroides]|uniref:Uncharacterized protein n=1 Tax=Protea cynaroides TaxID=273540 RepID=A0A9Q0H8A5_9MAGN|nr:hypothetical protein NE237_020989 [Protea cynaroides]